MNHDSGVDDDMWKFNHHAFLSQADARRKADANKNPFITSYGPNFDEFFSRVRDTEIQFYLPELKERMLRVIQEHPPTRPDDWQPPVTSSATPVHHTPLADTSPPVDATDVPT